MPLVIYIRYEEKDHPEKSSKLSIPSSWTHRPINDVMSLFIKPYNDKNPDHLIDINNSHLETTENVKIFSNSTVIESLGDRNDYLLKPGVYVRGSDHTEDKVKDTRPRCRNYGCNKHYDESENNDDSCEHHSRPPIFHDTAKFWSCCPEKKAYDFESFQALPACCKGKHSTNDPSTLIGPSPNQKVGWDGAAIETPSAPIEAPAPILKSISDFNKDSEGLTTSESSALKMLKERKSSRKSDGTARCQRKGCQLVFHVSDNHSNACCYHQGQPIFHDAIKFWSCCADKKCYDFDQFLAVPGCAVGFHDDGEIDLN